MGFLGYGATGQTASFENDGNQVSTSSRTGKIQNQKLMLAIADHVSPAGGSEASQTPRSYGNAKAKPSGDVCGQLYYGIIYSYLLYDVEL